MTDKQYNNDSDAFFEGLLHSTAIDFFDFKYGLQSHLHIFICWCGISTAVCPICIFPTIWIGICNWYATLHTPLHFAGLMRVCRVLYMVCVDGARRILLRATAEAKRGGRAKWPKRAGERRQTTSKDGQALGERNDAAGGRAIVSRGLHVTSLPHFSRTTHSHKQQDFVMIADRGCIECSRW